MELISPADFVENFLKNFDKEIIVLYSDKFAYNIYNHSIKIGLDIFNEEHAEWRADHIFLLKLNGYDFTPYCSYETFNLLHEMGHSQMRRLYKNKNFMEMVEQHLIEEEKIDYLYDNEKLDDFEIQELHMKDKLENDANAWAYLFVQENKEIVKQFDKIFLQLMGAMIK